MAIAVVPEVALREPNLLVPGRQPRGRVCVDSTLAPFTAGVWLAPDLHDLGPSGALIRGGTVLNAVYGGRRGWDMGGTAGVNTNYLRFPWYFDEMLGSTTSVGTICVSFTPTSLPNDNEKGIFHFGSSLGGSTFLAYLSTAGNVRIGFGHWNDNAVDVGAAVAGQITTLVIGFTEFVGCTIFRDGSYRDAISTATEIAGGGASINLGELGRVFQGDYGDSFPGLIHYCHIVRERLPDAACLEWSRNPYQFLVPA